MDIPSTSLINSCTPPNSCNIFPTDVLKWMKINAKAKPLLSLKLMQVCKYFQYKKFPYLVLHGIAKSNDDGDWTYWIFGDNQTKYSTHTLDIFAYKNLWITDFLFLYNMIVPFSLLLSKIAVCQAEQLCLYQQNLTFNEFKILTAYGTLKIVNMTNTIITGDNNDLASLKCILQCLPNIINLYFEEIVPSFTSKQVAECITASKMKTLNANLIPETFNFETFSAFMKSHPSIFCRLTFNQQLVLSPQYAQKLQQYVDKVIEENSTKYPPPVIHFFGEKENESSALDRLYERYIQENGNY